MLLASALESRYHLTVRLAAMNCPHCHRLLYSRRRKTCGYCGGELPDEVRLSEDEITAMKIEQQAIETRRALAKEKDEEEKRRRSSDSGGFLPPPMYME